MTTPIHQTNNSSPLLTPAPTIKAGPKTGSVTESFTSNLKAVEETSPIGLSYATRAPALSDMTEDQRIIQKSTDVPVSDDAFGFWDFVDLINPLQHIPLVSTLYRELTGDTIKPEVQIAGGVLMGLATGNILLSAATSVASAALEQKTGQEPAIMMAQALWGEDRALNVPDPMNEPTIMVAENTPALNEDTVLLPTAAPAVPVDRGPPLKTAENTATPQKPNQLFADAPLTAQHKEKNLGVLMQEQATAHASGTQLSPRLIEELMLHALDKYKTAHASTFLPEGDQPVVQ